MVDVHIGRQGVILLVILFILLAFEDILIWMNTGTIPAAEFFVAMLLVLGVVALALWEANLHPPPRH